MTEVTSIKLTSPPLVEALLGIQCPLNPGFSGFLLGSFWSEVSDVFTKPGLREGQAGNPRIKLVSADHNFVLQILDSGFFLSWVPSEGGEPYPGFPMLLSRFQDIYLRYIDFLKGNELPVPPVKGLSMGYTNLIAKPPNHEGLLVSSVFPDFSWRPIARDLSPPAFVNLGTTFQFPDIGCLVDARIDGPFPSDDPNFEMFLKFFLQARGAVEPQTDLKLVWKWFQDTKTALNQTFLGLTSDEFRQEYWGEETAT